jgi:Holliday junction DNA helicase RuvB
MITSDFDEIDLSSPKASTDESFFEATLRPQILSDYVGQKKIKDNLQILIDAAKGRKDTLEHILLYGPPGLGKTTLAHIIAKETGVNIKITSGPAIEKAGDLASLLTNLSENDVLFIDEIHRLNKAIEEILYPAMEDYALDIILGKGAGAKALRLVIHFGRSVLSLRTFVSADARPVWHDLSPRLLRRR